MLWSLNLLGFCSSFYLRVFLLCSWLCGFWPSVPCAQVPLDFLHHCGGCDLERESEKTAHSGYLDPFPLDPPPWSTIPCLHICNSVFTVNKCTELSSPECAPDSTSPLVLTVQGDDTRVFHMCGYRISYMQLIGNNKYRVEWTVPALKPALRSFWSIKNQKLPNLL